MRMTNFDASDRAYWREMARKAGYNANVLAEELGISRRHLQRYTRKLFERSPQAWLEEQRLALAVGLLKEHRSVKTVAFELGFKQPNHFSREFKRHHGISPTQCFAQNADQ